MSEKIKNVSAYSARMELGMKDKMYFSYILENDKNIKTVYDYGCADGAMIGLLAKSYPTVTFVGIDSNKDMIEIAKNRWQDVFNLCFVCGDYKDDFIKDDDPSSMIIFNSVIHEILTYSIDPNEGYHFWNWLNHSSFKYVCIREMCYGEDRHYIADSEVKEIHKKMLRWAAYNNDANFTDRYCDFFNTHGCYSMKEAVHFLLKHDYVENWERELGEEYFPYDSKEYLDRMPKFVPIYLRHYTLPYFKALIKSKFNIDINTQTHIKLIFRHR